MDTNQIKRIAEAAKAVTPGDPWFYQEESDAYTHIVRVDNPALRNSLIITQQPQRVDGVSEARARHIAAANPDVVLAMVAEIDRLKAELECARGDMRQADRIMDRDRTDAERYRFIVDCPIRTMVALSRKATESDFDLSTECDQLIAKRLANGNAT